MTIDIPLEIAETIYDILSKWCLTRTNEECTSCSFIDEDLACFLVELDQQIDRNKYAKEYKKEDMQ